VKIAISLFLTSLLALTSVQASDYDNAGATYSKKRPVDVDVNWSESQFETKPWIKEFRYVIVVNKANKGSDKQTLRLYEYGQLIKTTKVSTGRDQFERKGSHGSTADAWTVTPTGYYTPQWLSRNHKSNAYKHKWSWLTGGAKMPNAIFFNGGIAFHSATSHANELGSRASGGCVRLPHEFSGELFDRISYTSGSRIPKFTVNGEQALDKDGNPTYKEDGYSALIIVQNVIVE